MNKPICYDLYCGLGGWSEAFITEGYRCIGFDIEAHDYGTGGYPGELRIRDVRSIHGSELKDAACIVASPPCQAYSYRAMPWKRAKALPPPDNTLFNECFRIQREAIEAAGHWIPMVVENVRGAQKWVGRAHYHYGSFYLWGDVPALMPSCNRLVPDGCKVPGINWSDKSRPSQGFNVTAAQRFRLNEEELQNENKGNWLARDANGKRICKGQRATSSRGNSRKAASAMIAKIPEPLARHIARVYYPRPREATA